MNTVTLSGYVNKPKKMNGYTVFNLSVSRGKDKGNIYMRIKVFGDIELDEGHRVVVTGKLDSFVYNDKTYYEIIANSYEIGLIHDFSQQVRDRYQDQPQEPSQRQVQRTPQRQNPYNDGMSGPEDFADDDIPF